MDPRQWLADVRRRHSRGQQLAIAAALVALVGGLLPWMTVNGQWVLGFETDGFLGIMAGLSVLGIVTLREWGVVEGLAVAALGLIPLFAGASWLLDLARFEGLTNTVTPTVGLYVVMLAGLGMVVAGVLGLLEWRRTDRGDDLRLTPE